MDAFREALVRERAFQIWEDEGRPDGASERHWAMAEQQITDEAMDWETPENSSHRDLADADGPATSAPVAPPARKPRSKRSSG